jgi:hypothetical protein
MSSAWPAFGLLLAAAAAVAVVRFVDGPFFVDVAVVVACAVALGLLARWMSRRVRGRAAP